MVKDIILEDIRSGKGLPPLKTEETSSLDTILEDIRSGKGLPPLKSDEILSLQLDRMDDTSVQKNERGIIYI